MNLFNILICLRIPLHFSPLALRFALCSSRLRFFNVVTQLTSALRSPSVHPIPCNISRNPQCRLFIYLSAFDPRPYPTVCRLCLHPHLHSQLHSHSYVHVQSQSHLPPQLPLPVPSPSLSPFLLFPTTLPPPPLPLSCHHHHHHHHQQLPISLQSLNPVSVSSDASIHHRNPYLLLGRGGERDLDLVDGVGIGIGVDLERMGFGGGERGMRMKMRLGLRLRMRLMGQDEGAMLLKRGVFRRKWWWWLLGGLEVGGFGLRVAVHGGVLVIVIAYSNFGRGWER